MLLFRFFFFVVLLFYRFFFFFFPLFSSLSLSLLSLCLSPLRHRLLSTPAKQLPPIIDHYFTLSGLILCPRPIPTHRD